jgi:hypothetical protein
MGRKFFEPEKAALKSGFFYFYRGKYFFEKSGKTA